METECTLLVPAVFLHDTWQAGRTYGGYFLAQEPVDVVRFSGSKEMQVSRHSTPDTALLSTQAFAGCLDGSHIRLQFFLFGWFLLVGLVLFGWFVGVFWT